MKTKILALIIFSFILSINPLNAQNILVWKNVGESVFISPENGNEITPDFDIRTALAANIHNFALVTALPDDLSGFDIIFITLGFAVDCG